jgi:thiamine-phosphate pyrophosphorylase
MGRDLSSLRLLLVTDGQGDRQRVRRIVEGALRGGVRAVQLREPTWTAAELAAACDELWPRLQDVGGLLFVNDRVDVAAAGLAHGVQVGRRSLPWPLARRALGAQALLSASVHGARDLAAAAAAGADVALLAPVWPTTSKPGAPALGVAAAAQLTAGAALPVVWLGGLERADAGSVLALPPEQRPIGVAARSMLCSAADVEATARALVSLWAALGPR